MHWMVTWRTRGVHNSVLCIALGSEPGNEMREYISELRSLYRDKIDVLFCFTSGNLSSFWTGLDSITWLLVFFFEGQSSFRWYSKAPFFLQSSTEWLYSELCFHFIVCSMRAGIMLLGLKLLSPSSHNMNWLSTGLQRARQWLLYGV